MELGDLIKMLEAADPDMVVPNGFNHPHSYRGYYHELAFEPAQNVTVREMLEAAKGAVGTTYEGWKGGDFTMQEYSDCWLSEEGRAGGETLSAPLLGYLLDEAERAR